MTLSVVDEIRGFTTERVRIWFISHDSWWRIQVPVEAYAHGVQKPVDKLSRVF